MEAVMAVNPVALKSEITTDPRGYGWAAKWNAGDDVGLAFDMNMPRTGSNGGPAISLNRGTISSQELVEAIVQSEMPSNASQRDWLIMVASGVRVRVDTNSTARTGLLAIFGAATTTRANLTAASARAASRIEELFGLGAVVSADDIGLARQS
jgi:hypothetical protein